MRILTSISSSSFTNMVSGLRSEWSPLLLGSLPLRVLWWSTRCIFSGGPPSTLRHLPGIRPQSGYHTRRFTLTLVFPSLSTVLPRQIFLDLNISISMTTSNVDFVVLPVSFLSQPEGCEVRRR